MSASAQRCDWRFFSRLLFSSIFKVSCRSKSRRKKLSCSSLFQQLLGERSKQWKISLWLLYATKTDHVFSWNNIECRWHQRLSLLSTLPTGLQAEYLPQHMERFIVSLWEQNEIAFRGKVYLANVLTWTSKKIVISLYPTLSVAFVLGFDEEVWVVDLRHNQSMRGFTRLLIGPNLQFSKEISTYDRK